MPSCAPDIASLLLSSGPWPEDNVAIVAAAAAAEAALTERVKVARGLMGLDFAQVRRQIRSDAIRYDQMLTPHASPRLSLVRAVGGRAALAETSAHVECVCVCECAHVFSTRSSCAHALELPLAWQLQPQVAAVPWQRASRALAPPIHPSTAAAALPHPSARVQ